MQSKTCFGLIVALFVIESVWIAISSSYPMAFDEDFHFGIIKLYAAQWSPFFAHQPAHANAFGALTSDPSYLYHYLMSFPYRLISLWTSYQPTQIVCLRLIDVALVACSLVWFRALLLRTKASSALVNAALLFFVLIPVLPLLAGQINYDDLLLPLAALAMLTGLDVRQQLLARRVPVGRLLKLGAICMFASLVQFEFLPIFAAIAAYVGWQIWRLRRAAEKNHRWQTAWQVTGRFYRLAAVAVFLVALGLFGQRYGTNLVAYKTPVPQCNQVLTVSQCAAYTPWFRNYSDALQKTSVNLNPLHYSVTWAYGMFEHSFFISSSGANPNAMYIHISPLPIIAGTAAVIFGGGMLLLVCRPRRTRALLRQHQPLGFLLFISAVYCAVLWLWNFHDYVNLGAAVALNGRYLLPVMPPVMLAIGLAYRQWLGNRLNLKAGLLVIAFLLFLQGGGALTFIEASNANWYWSQSALPRTLNSTAQKIVKPLIIT
ncbi:MAG TPA: hypothetical protein VHC21_02830 [Candidatus Saccharimonadales bacterium]|nr:hypothetical protein [Candidatus Saccharimonadales bacterium]